MGYARTEPQMNADERRSNSKTKTQGATSLPWFWTFYRRLSAFIGGWASFGFQASDLRALAIAAFTRTGAVPPRWLRLFSDPSSVSAL
jgi:hypothetical protein